MTFTGTQFSTIADRRRRGTYDAGLELRDYAATAISATTNGTAVAFKVGKNECFKVAYSFAAYTSYSAGTAEWVATIGVATTSGGSYTTVATIPASLGAGAATAGEVVIGGEQASDLLADAEYIRLTLTKTGSPGNFTGGAWIVPC